MVTQKNNAFCSICTLNYLSYAATLNNSLRDVGHKEPHYVLVVDYSPKHKKLIEKYDIRPIFLKDLSIPNIDELIKKYSAFELSNILKPFFFEWLLKKYAELKTLIYLDTDIYVYSRFDDVTDYLKKESDVSLVLTSHISNYKQYLDRKDYEKEKLFILAGLYNGGFYALKNDKRIYKFLEWQKNRLRGFGYNAPYMQMFVDQKILDFAPLLFDFVKVYNNKAYNVGHWNYQDHEIKYDNGTYYIDEKKLVFFHFSNLAIDEKYVGKSKFFYENVQNNPSIHKMIKEYWLKLKNNDHEKNKTIPYSFNGLYIRPPMSTINPIVHLQSELELLQRELNIVKQNYEEARRSLLNRSIRFIRKKIG